MGHSAGGHLALLYAYKAAKCASCPHNDNCGSGNQAHENCPYDKHKVSPAIPIELVISEAGPTCFATSPSGPRLASDAYIQAMAGSNNTVDLYYASPLTYANSDSPYTVLAYGNGLPTTGYTYGDGFVPFTQATILQNVLGENDYSLFELTGVHHNQFGDDGDNDYEDTVFPGSTVDMIYEYYYGKEENEQITVAGLQQLIYTHLFANS